jgi:hypothetical protein
MPTRTEAIAKFMQLRAMKDLADLYTPNMEVQVNVARGDGEQVTGEYKGVQWSGWQNEFGLIWKNFRIPWNSWKDPKYTDSELKFSLVEHCESIGMTGWDFVQRCSRWVTFDIDSIIGHGAGLDDRSLGKVLDACKKVPWLTIRYSTGGKGYHIYVHFKTPVPTETHTEHAALARSVLTKLSQDTGHEFNASIDVCGGNAWVWHRRAEKTEGVGLSLFQAAITQIEAPSDWRDHIVVLRRKRSRPVPEGISEEDFAKVSGGYAHRKLDSEHQKLLDYLEEHGMYHYFQKDNCMLVTHTYHLKEAHAALDLRGKYDTVSTGSEYGQDKNCYAFPIAGGAWIVRRFSPGVTEHPLWTLDGAGWTRITFNAAKSGREAAIDAGLIPQKGGIFVAKEFSEIDAFQQSIGLEAEIPEALRGRQMQVRQDGPVTTLEIKTEQGDEDLDMGKGWRYERKTWKYAEIIPEDVGSRAANQQMLLELADPHLRYAIHGGTDGESTGIWYAANASGRWQTLKEPDLKAYLASEFGQALVNDVRTACLCSPWVVVHHPFQEEYPGSRQWNLDPVHFAFEPTEDGEPLNFKHWDMLLSHLGATLDEEMPNNKWAVDNGILTGHHYLKLWMAAMFRFPEQPLPFLFFTGPERGAKSMFFEVIEMIVSGNGVREAENSLTSAGGYNDELERCILAYIDEFDLSKKTTNAAQLIKKWVTAIKLTIHRKHMSKFTIPNLTHWVHCANNAKFCPVFPGDTRITVIYVFAIALDIMIPKEVMMSRLRSEAPDFLAHIMQLEIPFCSDRLRIPVIDTQDKLVVQEGNMTMVEEFMGEHCTLEDGYLLNFNEFCDRFRGMYGGDLSNKKIAYRIKDRLPRGDITDRPEEGAFLGNVRWNETKEEPTEARWIRKPQSRYIIQEKVVIA